MNTDDEDPVVAGAKLELAAKTWEPDTAEFRNIVRAMRPNTRGELMDIVCGEINAKNDTGEFTGFLPFTYVVAMETGYIASPGDHPDEKLARTIYNNMCGGDLPGY